MNEDKVEAIEKTLFENANYFIVAQCCQNCAYFLFDTDKCGLAGDCVKCYGSCDEFKPNSPAIDISKVIVDANAIQQCLDLVNGEIKNGEIKNCIDNPMCSGIAPKSLYKLRKNLEKALYLHTWVKTIFDYKNYK